MSSHILHFTASTLLPRLFCQYEHEAPRHSPVPGMRYTHYTPSTDINMLIYLLPGCRACAPAVYAGRTHREVPSICDHHLLHGCVVIPPRPGRDRPQLRGRRRGCESHSPHCAPSASQPSDRVHVRGSLRRRVGEDRRKRAHHLYSNRDCI